MTNIHGSCHVGKIILGIIVFGFALQLFFCLISVSVAVGTGYSVFAAIYHMLSWPMFFLSLCLAILMGILRCIKHCGQGSGECCPEDKCA